MIISIIGLGFVGDAMLKSFEKKGLIYNKDIFVYDKYKNGGIGLLEDVLQANITFLALPTQYNEETCSYNLESIYECCNFLSENKYMGTVVIKSTIEPGTIDTLEKLYPLLNFVHNPEFLTARTAFDDFHNQKHIVLGKGLMCKQQNFDIVKEFYSLYYLYSRSVLEPEPKSELESELESELKPLPESKLKAKISLCNSCESETMKICCNSFYAIKVQFFTELYMLCNNIGCDYNIVKNLMLDNNWINPMHTNIPGPDGKISYGGMCFPKDTNALNEFMKKSSSPSMILEACIKERNNMRNDK